MKNFLNRVAPFMPWVGLMLLVAGAIAYFITRRFDLATNIPFAVGAVLILLFAVLRPNDVRMLFGRRQTRYGTSTVLSIIFFAAIATLIYWLAFQNPDWRLDATETNEFTPLTETVDLLKTQDEPVRVIGFFSLQARGQQDQAESILQSMAAVSSNLNYEFQDPNAAPLLAQRYELETDATLVFIKGEDENEVFAKSESLSDRDIYTALLQVVNPVEKKAYFLAGHGERGIEDTSGEGIANFVGDLEDLGFVVEELNLSLTGAVPDDADVVALVDQQSPLQGIEIDALNSYLADGGAAFIIRDVVLDEARLRVEGDGLNAYLLDEWGVRIQSDLILEPQFGLSGQQLPLQFVSFDFGSSPITPSDFESFGVLFNLARSIDHQDAPGITYTDLVLTSESSWGETNFAALPEFDETDIPGPVSVALSAENAAAGSRLVVVGDAEFLSNGSVYAGANGLLASNAFNWLAGDETTLQLTPRETVERQANIPQSQLGVLQVISCLTGPALMALIGGVVWFTRRRNR